jgi:hypothetical protein
MQVLKDDGPQLRFPRDHQLEYKGIMEFRRITIAPPTIDLFGGFDFVENYLTQSLDDEGIGTGQLAKPTTDIAGVVEGRSQHTNSFPNITLYLPQAIQLNDSIVYDNTVQLGIAGAAVEQALNAGGSIFKAMNSALAAGTSTFTDLFNANATPDMARLAVARAAQMSPNQDVAEAFTSALRTTINPNRRTLFRAVAPREFSFQFKMVASSPEEAVEIEKIIYFFREEMYPEGLGEEFVVGYKYPNMFDIRMKYADSKVGYSFLPCYLSGFQTVINPTSMSFHADGKPSEVDVTMTFLEERSMMKNDIREGK